MNNRPLAVVTGASMGIGYELARVFAEHGYDLVVNADSEKIHDAARELQALFSAANPQNPADLYLFPAHIRLSDE